MTSKIINLIYKFSPLSVNLSFTLTVPIEVDLDNIDQIIDNVTNIGEYYTEDFFTGGEIKQLRQLYKNKCIELENVNPKNSKLREELKAQIDFFDKEGVNDDDIEVERKNFNYASYPIFEGLKKIDNNTYEVIWGT